MAIQDRLLHRFNGYILLVDPRIDDFLYEIYREADDGALKCVGYGPLLMQDVATSEACIELLKRAYNPEKDTFTVYPPLYDTPDQGENPPRMKSASEIDFFTPSISTNKPGLSS